MGFRSASIQSTTNFSSTTCVVSTPTGVITTDTLFAYLATTSANPPSTPVGWTFLGSVAASGAGPSSHSYIRTAGVGFPSSYTWTWAGPETGLMGGILAFTDGYANAHQDGTSLFHVGVSPATLTIPVHAVATSGQVIYGTYCKPPSFFTGGIITKPPESILAIAANWIPADVGAERAGMSLSYELLLPELLYDTSEPARNYTYTWDATGPNPLDIVAQRQIAINPPPSGRWGWVDTATKSWTYDEAFLTYDQLELLYDFRDPGNLKDAWHEVN